MLAFIDVRLRDKIQQRAENPRLIHIYLDKKNP